MTSMAQDTTDRTRRAAPGEIAGGATFVGMPAFPQAAREALADSQLRHNLAHATGTIRDKRARVVAEVAKHDVTDAVVRVRYTADENQHVDVSAVRAALGAADTVAAIERDVAPVVRRQRRRRPEPVRAPARVLAHDGDDALRRLARLDVTDPPIEPAPPTDTTTRKVTM